MGMLKRAGLLLIAGLTEGVSLLGSAMVALGASAGSKITDWADGHWANVMDRMDQRPGER